MAKAELQFDQRLKRIVQRHAKMRRGSAAVMTRDGLIVARPRRRAPRFPFQGMLLLLLAASIFKAMMYVSLGGVEYDQRVATLSDGNMAEQVGAYLLQPDPITVWVSENVNRLLR